MSRAACLLVVLIAVLGFSWPCLADQEAGVVAYYSFEEGAGETVKDWSGNGNDGENNGAQYVDLEEGRGLVLRFGDGEAYVDCGNGPSLDLSSAATIEMWLYAETTPYWGEAGLVGKRYSSYVLVYNGFSCGWYVNGTGGCMVRGPGLVPRRWSHIVATFEGNDQKIYTDGEISGTLASKHDKINTDGGNFFLRYPVLYRDEVKPPFKCMMDDVRVYNRVLTPEEVLSHYEEGRYKREGTAPVPGQMVLTPYVYPAPAKLRVAVDVAGLRPIAEGSTVAVQLWDPVGGKVLGRYRIAGFRESDTVDAVFSIAGVPPGHYQIRAVARDRKGSKVGSLASEPVHLTGETPAWLQTDKGVKVLNNLVIELLNVQTPPRQRHYQYRVTNPRDGWLFISSTAEVEGADRVLVVIDATEKEEAVIVHESGQSATLEAMRHLPAGAHTLDVYCEGAGSLNSFIVRAVPEVLYAGLGYRAWLQNYGPYTMEYLDRIGMLDSLNVLIVRNEIPQDAPYLEEWKKQGKKLFGRSGYDILPDWRQKGAVVGAYYDHWSQDKGFQEPRYDGLIVSEFGPWYPYLYPSWIDAVRRISQNPQFKGKALYAYSAGLYLTDYMRDFVQAIIEGSYKLAEEQYLAEQPTEAAARELLDVRLKQNMLRYQEAFPDCQKHMIETLGYLSTPGETHNHYPGVDYKVWLDMHMNLLANDPVFFGLYGVMFYHSAYADEEALRWSAKLFRHYCIEGNTEMLSDDPYLSAHLQNPNFDHGSDGWTFLPAEEGSMAVKNTPGFVQLQGRSRPVMEEDSFLWTRRSAAGPNRFAQRIKALEPGRLYSLKMFTADYTEFIQGKSVEQDHQVSVKLEGVELLPDKCFAEDFASGCRGHAYGSFNRANPLWITFHRLVFRANNTEGTLTVSDWTSDTAPGGPIGQELMHNFLELQPYLED
ncbi:MAG: LamG domain-containing protein [Armatimonadetes bacterium]|nr:LamG domain-containing protein [Armatimonadota bacterium]